MHLLLLLVLLCFAVWLLQRVFVRVRPQLMKWYFSHECAPFELEKYPEQIVPLPPKVPRLGEGMLRSFASSSHTPTLHAPNTLRVVVLNMEMGRQLDAIIHQLRRLDPDIVLLQEVDVGVARTRKLDTGAQVAHALNMHYFFACEIVDPCRTATATATASAPQTPITDRGTHPPLPFFPTLPLLSVTSSL